MVALLAKNTGFNLVKLLISIKDSTGVKCFIEGVKVYTLLI